MSEVVTSGDPEAVVIVSEGPAALTVRGYGDSEGDAVAMWAFAALAAAGAGPSSLDAVESPFSADGTTLRTPSEARLYPAGSRGIILRCVDSAGDEYCESSFRWGEYGAWTIQLPTAGRQLTCQYRANSDGVNDDGDGVTLQVKAGQPALDRAVTVTAHLLQDAVGVTEQQLAAQQAATSAKDATQDSRLDALEARETHGGVSGAEARSIADEEIAAANLAPAAVRQRIKSAHDDAAANVLTLDLVDAAGNVRHLAVNYGGTGQSGLTAQAAVAAAMAKLATDVAEFSWDAASSTLTFAEPSLAAGSVTEQQLAQAVRDRIDAALRANQVQPVARADIADDALSAAQKRAFRERIDAPDAAGLETVATDPTINGTGAEDDPIGVANPPGPAFVAGAVDITAQKMADINRGFREGGWLDAAGAIDSTWTVSTVARAAKYSPAEITQLDYSLYQRISPRQENVWFGVRAPEGSRLARARVRIGDDSGDEFLINMWDDPTVEHTTTAEVNGVTFDFFQLLAADLPEGDTRRMQVLTRFRLDEELVEVAGTGLLTEQQAADATSATRGTLSGARLATVLAGLRIVWSGSQAEYDALTPPEKAGYILFAIA